VLDVVASDEDEPPPRVHRDALQDADPRPVSRQAGSGSPAKQEDAGDDGSNDEDDREDNCDKTETFEHALEPIPLNAPARLDPAIRSGAGNLRIEDNLNGHRVQMIRLRNFPCQAVEKNVAIDKVNGRLTADSFDAEIG
jgi:hypothetical protein